MHLAWFMVQPYDALVSYFVKQNKTTRSSPPVFLLMVVTQTVCNDSINKRWLLLSEKIVPQKFELTDKSAANRRSRGNQLTCRRASSPVPRSTIAATLDALSCETNKKDSYAMTYKPLSTWIYEQFCKIWQPRCLLLFYDQFCRPTAPGFLVQEILLLIWIRETF